MTSKIEELEKEIEEARIILCKCQCRGEIYTKKDKSLWIKKMNILQAELKGLKEGKQETLKQVEKMIDECLNGEWGTTGQVFEFSKQLKQKLGELK